jgi:ribosome-associated toxin RatA of RatAB toxin-antitoxin module
MLERGSAIAFALMLMLAVLLSAAAATVTLNSKLQGDEIDIQASAMLNADAATAWRVLTDYDRYAEFIPDLRVSRVVARDGAKITVEQSGDAAFWLFKMPVNVTFEVIERPPNSLQSRTVAGSMRVLASSYALVPVASGVRLDYTGQIVPGFELVGRIEQMAVERNAARQFQALADEIERSSAALRRHVVAERQ